MLLLRLVFNFANRATAVKLSNAYKGNQPFPCRSSQYSLPPTCELNTNQYVSILLPLQKSRDQELSCSPPGEKKEAFPTSPSSTTAKVNRHKVEKHL